MFDWLLNALYNYYLTLGMVSFVMFMLGVGTHAMMHHCRLPETGTESNKAVREVEQIILEKW